MAVCIDGRACLHGGDKVREGSQRWPPLLPSPTYRPLTYYQLLLTLHKAV